MLFDEFRGVVFKPGDVKGMKFHGFRNGQTAFGLPQVPVAVGEAGRLAVAVYIAGIQ